MIALALILAFGVCVLAIGLGAIVLALKEQNDILTRGQALQAARVEAMRGGGRERLRARLESIAERKAAKGQVNASSANR